MHTPLLARRGTRGLQLGALLLWFITTLSLFRVLSPFLAVVSVVLGRVWSVGSFNISAGDVLAFVITLWLAVLISRLIRFLLNEDVLPRIDLPRGVPGAISTVAHYVILGIGFVFAVGAAGIDLSQFALLAGAFGVGIGSDCRISSTILCPASSSFSSGPSKSVIPSRSERYSDEWAGSESGRVRYEPSTERRSSSRTAT